jgi:hypothetical protein
MKACFLLILMFVCIAMVSPASLMAKDKDPDKQEFMGYVRASNEAGAQPVPIRITIDRYSTDAEIAQYKAMLKSDGQDALLKSISKNNLGFFQPGPMTSRQLIAARSVNQPDGSRKVTALYASVTGDYQVRAASNVGDFPFALIEMVIKPNYEATGFYVPAIGVTIRADGSLDLENLGTFPMQFVSLHQEKPKEKK